MSNKRILVVSLVAGLLATALMWSYLASRERELLQLAEPVRVVIAVNDVPRGSSLTDDMVQVADVPKKYVQPGAVTDIEQAVGQRLATGIRAGAQVLAAHLSSSSTPTLSYLVPPSQRAVTVAVDDVTGVAGLLQPGDAVDVVAVFETGSGDKSAGGHSLARTVLQDVKVLAVGVDIGARRDSQSVTDEGESGQRVERRPEIENVTLLADPQQARALVLAQQIGAITLVLRAEGDNARTDVTLTIATDVTGITSPTRPPAKPTWQHDRDNR